MKILFFYKDKNSSIKKIQNQVEKLFHSKNIAIYHSFKYFSARLHRPKKGLDVLILVAGDVLDLSGFIELKDCLKEFRIILVLPDHDGKILAMGHKIFPRFVSYIDSDLSDIVLVLENILDRHRKSIGFEGNE